MEGPPRATVRATSGPCTWWVSRGEFRLKGPWAGTASQPMRQPLTQEEDEEEDEEDFTAPPVVFTVTVSKVCAARTRWRLPRGPEAFVEGALSHRGKGRACVPRATLAARAPTPPPALPVH